MDLDTILMWVRFCIHVATFLIIYCYRPKGARQRWGVSILAIVLAGSSVGFAVFIISGVISPTFAAPQWLHIAGWGAVLGLVAKARGNVAKMVSPRQERSAQ
jgi:Protein of unknown function (DUF754).